MLCSRRRFVASLLGAFSIQFGVFLGNLVKQFHHCQLFLQILIELEFQERRKPQR